MLSKIHIALPLVAILLSLGLTASASAEDADYTPPTTEITPDHPLFIFEVPRGAATDPAVHADAVIRAWGRLPDPMKAFATLQVDAPGDRIDQRHAYLRRLLDVLREADIPTVIRIADANPLRAYPLDKAEELLKDFTLVKGIQVIGLQFDEYPVFGGGAIPAVPPAAQWLGGAIDLAARYGRFIAVELDELNWPRVMANASCASLRSRMRLCRDYVVPVAAFRDGHTIAQQSAAMGLWLEGSVAQWGVAPSSDWYANTGLIAPGLFGRGGAPGSMPPSLYRAMILCGAMTGANVYSFRPGDDLWFGERAGYWEQAIQPTLNDLMRHGLMPRQDLVMKKVKVAYQLAPARSPREFHLNLRDIDAIRDEGLLLKGAYGVERAGQIPELVPNSGRHYWVPIISPDAPKEFLDQLEAVVPAGSIATADAWTQLLDRHYVPDGMGSAFICRVGRGIFVLQTRDNLYEAQNYRVPNTPAPVRGLKARRTDEGVEVAWPFREYDVAYRVYRQTLPDGALELVGADVDAMAHEWLDHNASSEESYAYTVTALTTETGVQEGTVNFGDYLAISVIESLPAEEVVITPLLGYGKGRPIEKPDDARPLTQSWWPGTEGLGEKELAPAQAIAGRIDVWADAFAREDLDAVMDLYAVEYADPQSWQFQYVRRAYQWFFERYGACKMTRQVQAWDFSGSTDSGEVQVVLYCRFTGNAVSDPSGRFADQTAFFPRDESGEVRITFVQQEGGWRIMRTDPALPNLKDILSFSAGPFDAFAPGADVYAR
ncbi:MAG: hypothetical protein GY851_13315 [bacterium]|nr:hypothetical protein [bacterium]